jgi:hypothetical protein
MKLSVAAVAAAALLASATPALASPPPPFTCPSQSVCNFQHGDWTGLVQTVSNTSGNRDRWLSIAENGSRNNTTGAHAFVACLAPHTRVTMDGGNYIYIDYGVTSGCAGIPVGP